MNAALLEGYGNAGVPVADVAGAFDIADFGDTVEVPGVGPVPLSVANACAWTWFCQPPPKGPDIHPNTAGYGVIADAFEEVLT